MAKAKMTSLKTVREEAAKTIMKLQDGKVSPLVADAIYKQSLTIVDSYRVQIRSIELAIAASENTDFKKALKTVENMDKLIIP